MRMSYVGGLQPEASKIKVCGTNTGQTDRESAVPPVAWKMASQIASRSAFGGISLPASSLHSAILIINFYSESYFYEAAAGAGQDQ